MKPVKVFLSYSHDSEEHAERVRALADRLRADGLDCVLDQYEPAPSQGWPLWMEEQVAAADFVLVIATATYRRRAAGKERPGTGHGVRFESVLVVQELYDAGMRNEKFIPVLFAGARDEDVPPPLRAYTRYRLEGDAGYEALYRRLTGQPLVRKPELGERRILPSRETASLSSSGSDQERKGPSAAAPNHSEPGASLTSPSPAPWWRRWRLVHLGIGIGIVGALLTIAAWLWSRLPVESATAGPAIYALRVQVLDPDGRPVDGSTVRVSAVNERQRLPDGWWEVEVAAAKLPEDRRLTIWAEHPEWQSGRAELELGTDPNPRVEVRLQVPESSIRGIVVDAGGSAIAGARVTPRGPAGEAAVSDRDGGFELTVAAARGESVRVHVRHPDFRPTDAFCYAGRDNCPIVLEVP